MCTPKRNVFHPRNRCTTQINKLYSYSTAQSIWRKNNRPQPNKRSNFSPLSAAPRPLFNSLSVASFNCKLRQLASSLIGFLAGADQAFDRLSTDRKARREKPGLLRRGKGNVGNGEVEAATGMKCDTPPVRGRQANETACPRNWVKVEKLRCLPDGPAACNFRSPRSVRD